MRQTDASASLSVALGRIAERGVVLSEVPCGTAPTKWRFLQRNRLIAAATQAMADPAFFQRTPEAVAADTAALTAAQQELDLAYARWAELEG